MAHYGNINERVEHQLTCLLVEKVKTKYRSAHPSYKIVFEDDNGNLFLWETRKPPEVEAQTRYHVWMTIKGHFEDSRYNLLGKSVKAEWVDATKIKSVKVVDELNIDFDGNLELRKVLKEWIESQKILYLLEDKNVKLETTDLKNRLEMTLSIQVSRTANNDPIYQVGYSVNENIVRIRTSKKYIELEVWKAIAHYIIEHHGNNIINGDSLTLAISEEECFDFLREVIQLGSLAQTVR